MTEENDQLELPAMLPGELKSMREYLGLSTSWIAETLVIGERRIQRMETGQEPIITAVIDLIDTCHDEAKKLVDQMVAVYRRKVKAAAGHPAMLPTYRTDAIGYTAGLKYPARWHRHIAARVSDSCPGAIIVYTDQIPAGMSNDDE